MESTSELSGLREAPAFVSSWDTCDVLNDLIEICKDAQLGYEQAANEAQARPLEQTFRRLAKQRVAFAHELQAQVRMLGGDPERSGTVLGALRRGWRDLKYVVGARQDADILNDCDLAEEACKTLYREANGMVLPPHVHFVVARQLQGVRQAHDEIRRLRDVAQTP